MRRASALDDFNLLYHRVYLKNIPLNTFRKNLHCKKLPIYAVVSWWAHEIVAIISNSLQWPHKFSVGSGLRFGVAILGDIIDFIYLAWIPRYPLRWSPFSSLNIVPQYRPWILTAIIAWGNRRMDNRGELLYIFFARLHEMMLLHFLQSDLPTARAALETLVPFAYEAGRKDAFTFLPRASFDIRTRSLLTDIYTFPWPRP